MNDHSALYTCDIMHHRLVPLRHRFDYRLYMLHLDLAELPALHRNLRLLSHNKFNLHTIRDSDHLRDPALDPYDGLTAKITAWLRGKGATVPDNARATLLTLPRVLGHIFNPVSFYFIHPPEPHSAPTHAVVEVGNTFGEFKLYHLPHREEHPPGTFHLTTPKHFYVSPFTTLETHFDFHIRHPGETLSIQINDLDPATGRPTLVTSLTGRREPLTDRTLALSALRFPLVTLQTITLIHWQALRLFLKRLPFHLKEDSPHLQRDIINPHSSLKPKN